MSWKNIKLIFLREVRDQLRDRRTLFMVAVLPLLLYPALGIGMVQMTVTFEEQTRSVVVLGVDEIPSPKLIDGTKFRSDLFKEPASANKLRVISDATGNLEEHEIDEELRQEFTQFLDSLSENERKLQRLAVLERDFALDETYERSDPELAELIKEQQALRKEAIALLADSPAEVVILFPAGFKQAYADLTSSIADGAVSEEMLNDLPRPFVIHNSANERSEIAFNRANKALAAWEDEVLTDRLSQAKLPVAFTDAIPITDIDLAEADEIAANVWSKIFPALLVIMSVTGAFYPAIDLGAGEKERGTMETLLISPATRAEIVFGKFLTVMLFSISTALLNLASMGFTGKHMLTAVSQGAASPLGDLSFPPLLSLLWVVLLAIPLSALFSALSLSLAMFAKSSKEGQYYLTPLLMVTMGLTMFCLNPSIELTPYYSVLPVVGPALLLKSLLLEGATSSSVVTYVLPVLITSITYSGIALWWAIDQFQSEGILFREAERFDLGLWFRHLLRDKEETPSFSEATVCFVLIAMLQFLFLTSMQSSPSALSGPVRMVQVQLIYLIATVGVPPVLMGLLLTTNLWKTLKLHLPNWKYLLAACLLPLSLQPLTLELMSALDPFFPPLPPGAEQMMQAMATDTVPLWLTLATFALAPAVCEELAFRGFILSGLQRSKREWLPIIISAMLFGVIHMIPKQQFNAALLGLVLGLLAVRSQSLWPGVVFHFVFNGVQVLAARLTPEALTEGPAQFVFRVGESGTIESVSFQPVFLVVCAVVSGGLLYWLLNSGKPSTHLDSNSNLNGSFAAE
ncbi:ABC transporter permease subunit/CPBP intramembrane protease [Thalassoglobus sp. JC818]|uniref:ABC transporter permease subunit/CPBP intramembrane protease n=1 Tax=Thalassoglobus sp. JC818 TaxID=3232136 RepID=UPI00345AD06D